MLPFILPAIGAGMGLLSGLFNKPQQQNTTDQGLNAYLQQIRGMGLSEFNAPEFQSAIQMLQGATGQNPMMAQQAMNPYLSAMQPLFDQLRRGAVTGANQQATLAGAFGGTGSQIGADIAGNLADQNQAGFNYDAFNQAMQRLMSGAQGMMAIPGQRMGLLSPGTQSANTTTTVPSQFNPFTAMLGGGMMGYGAQYGGGLMGKGFGSGGGI